MIWGAQGSLSKLTATSKNTASTVARTLGIVPAAHPAHGEAATPSAQLPENTYTEPITLARAGVRRPVGHSDLRVFPVALGTSVFGWTVDRQTSMSILDRFFLLGGNFIDTADNYASGQSEMMIGNWLRTRGSRDRVVLATKVGQSVDNPGLKRRGILAAVEASLERLQTDYIDLLYFHFDDPFVPLEDSLAAAHELIESGKVRYLGASNYSGSRLMEARVLSANGLPRFEAIQEHYNLMHRKEYETDAALAAGAQQLGVIPHFPLAHGFLGGEYRSRADGVGNARRMRAGQHITRHGFRVLAVVERVAHEHGVSPATVALAWLLSKQNIVAPVVSADTLAHVDDMISSTDLRLTEQQLNDLDRVSAYSARRHA
ncbi:aldo/keto reductase [Lysinibacter cavernae]|uniref:Aryl-alcohol dehydrogenase-like predicted oxidoreductase n=1 Tax=Lysinibacter cavernae TaxID=1640652 RepID=A0A7X5QY82_9MICO|nr:aldo/keto reductase [Lysinibacter cavernae]NIH52185.1 aryl-alcohol dehydrogenase-like predicted oxidoreductase [Lysinibacter cavernae]